jgi:threonine dehydrogenase-like Zn-dependent dehydrogenase
VGQFAIRSAFMLGAERVIAIDSVPERLQMAEAGGAELVDYGQGDLFARLREMTGGRGPDACIDAVGMEAHGMGLYGLYDKVKQSVRLETDRPIALREAIMACRKGGVVSIPGVYGGIIDKMPIGAAFNKGLTFRMGQTHMQRYLRPLHDRIVNGEIDPSFVITHRLNLDEAPEAYRTFRDKKDGCIKVVLKP